MFGFIPPVTYNDGKNQIDIFDSRKEGDQVNIDFVRVITTDDNDQQLTTQFGIQGRSDHLAKLLADRKAKADAEQQSIAQFEADAVAVINDLPLVDVDRNGVPVTA